MLSVSGENEISGSFLSNGVHVCRRSATLNRALLLLGFALVSSLDGFMTLRRIKEMLAACPQTHCGVFGGQMQSDDASRKMPFTNLSSREW